MQEIQRELGDVVTEFERLVEEIKGQAGEVHRYADPIADKFAEIAVHIADISATHLRGELFQKGFALAAAIADLGSTYALRSSRGDDQ